MEISILPLPKEKMKNKVTDESTLGFGRVFTDRMFLAEWKPDLEWHAARIQPYAPFTLDPSTLVFHYAQEIFEGLKAYVWENGNIALFRPEKNARRFNQSAERLCMPQVPEEFFLKAISELVLLEREWIPKSLGTSLYIRPTMIAVEPVLGVKPSSHYYFYIILSPVGAYYHGGFKPVKIWIETQYIRSAIGGTGEAKTGANYAASLKATAEAKAKGYDQVLWLDAVERRYVEEVGAMNMFFIKRDTVMTPILDGSILNGVTRDCVIQLAKSFGYYVKEVKIDVEELVADVESGNIQEAFGSGTAAVITPVGRLGYKNRSFQVGDGQVGPLTQKMYDTITQIQYGKTEDLFGWVQSISQTALV